ncbi:hypothetical protein LIPSTDRAFT_175073 [Lipomyces starkeyi NRRL Y-11557]|uniref:Uncharacterized protein n=1 Tax=Lipomyces starkeyi NRRL Y-11557 TaxID=675824 RepID=A0A1E3PXD6_LIPST|nr:hypothetical protein LIPSTDRAFT_175073 [Lipomyces starkeyi NRRL Y-11557]
MTWQSIQKKIVDKSKQTYISTPAKHSIIPYNTIPYKTWKQIYKMPTTRSKYTFGKCTHKT